MQEKSLFDLMRKPQLSPQELRSSYGTYLCPIVTSHPSSTKQSPI